MEVKIEGSNLVIRIPIISPARMSGSGKTRLVATSSGNKPTTVIVEGKPVTVGVNAYISA